jgi:tripartite motif-containing protein 71
MIESIDQLPPIEIALLLTSSENQIEKFASMYKSLQPKEEYVTFIPPNFDLLQEIRNQGEIVINNRNANNQFGNGNGTCSVANNSIRRPIPRQNNGNNSTWTESTSPETASSSPVSVNVSNTNSSMVVSNKTYASIVKPPAVIIGQCIPGSQNHVSVKPALAPSKTLQLNP